MAGSAPSSVAYTLVGQNNSLIQGNFGPPTPAQIAGAVYVPPLNEVFIGDTAQYSVFGLNGSTGLLENTIHVAWDPQGLAYDTRDGTLLVATGASVAVVDLTKLAVRGWINGTGGTALAYDPNNGLAYVADFNNAVVRALNLTSRQIVANISVGAEPDALAFDS
ncbi:MAG: hypothetical protein L3J96_02325, partial [Thermoplasmata archaeon]|nr:hypothetical protein [Thermoplasmata archaeon]